VKKRYGGIDLLAKPAEDQLKILAMPAPRTRARPSLALLTALLLGAVGQARPAAAQGATVLPDLGAPPELSEQAAAVSLLLRSYVKTGERPLVPRHELALAIEAFTGHAPRDSLAVTQDLAPRLAEQLGADRILFVQLQQSPKRLMATGAVYGPAGKRIGRISVSVAMGELGDMAHQIAERLAPTIGATVIDGPSVGLAELRPFVAAQAALLVGDAAAAARAIEIALPNTTAAQLPAVHDLLRSLAEEPGLLKQTRVQARLLMGDWAAAVELADEGLEADPKNVALRAAKARAKVALRDFDAAERELDLLKGARNVPAVVVARAALAVERGDPVAKRDEALAPLLGRPASEWRVALPLVAASAPGTFGPQVESAALTAAQKIAPQEPGLASTVATRALTGGASVSQAAPLIKVQDLSAEQVKVVSSRLDKVGGADPATAALSQEIKSRQIESEQARAAARGPEKPVGPPSTLARNLHALLQKFDLLFEPTLSTVTIAPLPGSGQPFYWPFLVRPEALSGGLLEALMRPPWELNASRSQVRTEELPVARATEEALAVLAHDMGSEAVLMYRIQPAGLAPWVDVELILFDVPKQQVYRASGSLVGRSTGLVMINPLIAALFVLALLGAGAWVTIISFRGAIVARVQWDPDSKDEMFSILISRSNKAPVIENTTAYKKKLDWLGQRKRRFEAWHVERSTTFRGIPKGKYFVHLYGIYTRGRQVLVLNEPYETVEVFPRKTAFAVFNLEASEAEFKLTVVDDSGLVEGARVWLDQDRAKAAATHKEGSVTLKVPKGYHVIHVTAKGIHVERPYHVIKAKVHEMTINLVWERRQEHASRALERQVDDALLPYLTVSRKPQGTGVSPGTATGRRSSDSMDTVPRATQSAASDDSIDIPLAGGASVAPAGSIQGPLGRPSQVSRAPAAARSVQPTRRPTPVASPAVAGQPGRRPTPVASPAVASAGLSRPAPRPSPSRPQAAAPTVRPSLRPLTAQAAAPDDANEPPVDLNLPVDLGPNPAAPVDLGAPVDLVGPPSPDEPVDLVPPPRPRRTR
jgi:hypothetical protein